MCVLTKKNILIEKTKKNNFATCRTICSLSILQNIDNSFSQLSNFGSVVTVIDGIIKIKDLPQAQMGELVTFVETKDRGLVLNIEKDFVSVVVLGTEINILPGYSVMCENKLVSIVASRGLKGHVVNSLGEIIDAPDLKIQLNVSPIVVNENFELPEDFELEDFEDNDLVDFPEDTIGYLDNIYKVIEAPAPSIMNRTKITEPLYTGTTIIDSAIPIGKGQRELIIGDRQIGKTTLAVDTILNQSNLIKYYGYCGDSSVVSVYVSIGQKMSSVVRLFYDLVDKDAVDSTIIVASTASEPASLQFLAPYTGCTLGEFFRDAGFHAVVIYDDLSKHAVAYRQMALLLRRPSGREAYPGDIFYIHSRLLERAAAIRNGGTLTALPIIETQAGDVSAYIPTNIISITDGQIFLESELFYKGVRPAINIALSVSRIGSSAQNAALKKVSATLKLDLVQYREVEVFSMFGSDLDESTRLVLHRGVRLVELLKQEPNQPIHPLGQAVLIYSGIKGFLDLLSIENISIFKQKIIDDSIIGAFPFDTYDAIAFNDINAGKVLASYLEQVIFSIK